MSELLSPSQAARILDVSAKRVVQLCDAKRLPCERTTLGRLIPREAVEAYRVATYA